MRGSRSLVLRREQLTELTTDDLALAGGAPDTTGHLLSRGCASGGLLCFTRTQCPQTWTC